jgi:hypothetical protein
MSTRRSSLDLPLPADRRAQVLKAERAKEWFSPTEPLRQLV